ncbi:MAG: ParB/RepB/Spo0J family partition protein [Pseudomonadales bacterium]
MAGKKKGLGRGLDALLGGGQSTSISNRDPAPTNAPASQPAETAQTAASSASSGEPAAKSELQNMPIDLIRPGEYQPRRDMHPDALEELAASIKAQGVMQPIVVRSVGMGQYEIIAGERRWRASQQAGLDTIPVLIKDVPDEAAIAMALIENIQREDLNAMEEATALARLQSEFDLTHQEIADAVGKSRSSVSNLLRLMQLQFDVRTLLERGDLELGHAKALLALEGATQSATARKVVAQGLSVRQTEALVRKTQQGPASKKPESGKTNDTIRLEQQLGEKVGLPVAIDHKANGKGSVTFTYNTLDELDGLLDHIQ